MKILILNTEKYKNEISHNSTVCVCAFLCFLFSLLLKPVALALFHLHSHAMGRKTIKLPVGFSLLVKCSATPSLRNLI